MAPQAHTYPYCCGMTIISSFPGDGTPYPTTETVEKVGQDLAKMTLYQAQRGAAMVILNTGQKKMQAEVVKHGFAKIGSFKTTHGGGALVTVFVKGMVDLPGEAKIVEKEIEKPCEKCIARTKRLAERKKLGLVPKKRLVRKKRAA